MYAVVKQGGKQHRVGEGDTFKVEKVPEEIGAEIEIKDVLMLNDNENISVGTPFVKSASIVCKVVEHKKEKKIIVFKHKRRKGYRKKQGHRQMLTTLEVLSINR